MQTCKPMDTKPHINHYTVTPITKKIRKRWADIGLTHKAAKHAAFVVDEDSGEDFYYVVKKSTADALAAFLNAAAIMHDCALAAIYALDK